MFMVWSRVLTRKSCSLVSIFCIFFFFGKKSKVLEELKSNNVVSNVLYKLSLWYLDLVRTLHLSNEENLKNFIGLFSCVINSILGLVL